MIQQFNLYGEEGKGIAVATVLLPYRTVRSQLGPWEALLRLHRWLEEEESMPLVISWEGIPTHRVTTFTDGYVVSHATTWKLDTEHDAVIEAKVAQRITHLQFEYVAEKFGS